MKTLARLKTNKDYPKSEMVEENLQQASLAGLYVQTIFIHFDLFVVDQEISMGYIPSSLLNESFSTTFPSVVGFGCYLHFDLFRIF